jgi:type IV pilus assembly protein PilW
MKTNNTFNQFFARQSGVTMVELMVALAIGSFLMIGAIQVYNQSRQAYIINDSIARVQETAQFAMDTVEADLRMASNWGQHSRGRSIEGRSLVGDVNPLALNAPIVCGGNWALNLGRPLEGTNNAYALPCAATGGAQANSDVITTRRATVNPTLLDNGRLQIQTTRIQGALFDNGAIPAGFTAADSETHDLLVNTYYVSPDSTLIPGVPTLRRKTLTVNAGVAIIQDQEVAPGVENLQLQFGVDIDDDNTVDRYVNPGDNIFNPADVTFIPGAKVITARIWLVVRSLTREVGLEDLRDYEPGDIDLGVQNDQFRRLQVSKTILLRNARS